VIRGRWRAWRSSGRAKAVGLLWQVSPGLAAVVAVSALASAALPIATTVSAAVVVGKVPQVVDEGLGSAAGHALIRALVLVGVFNAVALLIGPLHQSLSTVVKARVDYTLQQRLMAAVSRPTGIAHLENAALLDQLAVAQGTLLTYPPGEAPVLLARVIGNRLQGLAACVLVSLSVWWMGIVLLALWLGLRRPLRRVISEQVQTFAGKPGLLRRADYFQDLAVEPAAGKEIRVFGTGEWVVAQFRDSWLRGMQETWSVLGRLNLVVMRLGWLVLVLHLALGAALVQAGLNGEITLTQAAIVVQLMPLAMLVGTITYDDVNLEWAVSPLPMLETVQRTLAAAAAEQRGTRDPSGCPREGIVFDHVGFRYPGSDRSVFDDLSLTITAGRSTAIVGANGVGKTTLVKLLTRLHDPTGGRVLVDGVDVRELDPAAWQRRSAVVFQDSAHYPFSAADNVGFGAPLHLDEVRSALAAGRAGAAGVIEGLPDGWDTTLSAEYTGGVDLSGGQWQRIALARALFAAEHGAGVLVLDEPTAWLDVRGEAEFFDRFLEITADLTTVIISHRFSTVRRADVIVVLDEGRVVEQGSHDELLAHQGLYARMFRLQAERFEDSDEAVVG